MSASSGFVADLLSSEVQVGYMNGLAIVIIVGQLPKLSGFSTDADTFVEEVREFVTNFDQRDATALGVGLATLAVLLVLPRITRAIPAVLVAVVGATVVTAVFDLDIATVGSFPRGCPRPAVPWTDFDDVVPLLVAAVGITLVSLTDTIALSTSFNARRGEQVKPNQEMIGIGSANVAAGFFRGFAISASSSRTAVAEQSGAKSQLAGVVGAGDRRAAARVLQRAPRRPAELGAGGGGHRRRPLARRLLACSPGCGGSDRSAVLLSLVASAGVIFLGVLEGIVVAIVLSILLFFHRNWWPHGEVLGRVPGREGWHSDQGADGFARAPRRGRVPLGGAAVLRQRRHLRRPGARAGARSAGRRGWCCSARRSPTSTSPRPTMLERLDNELNAKGVHLAFVELRTRLRDLVHDYGLLDDARPRPLLRLDRRSPRRHRLVPPATRSRRNERAGGTRPDRMTRRRGRQVARRPVRAPCVRVSSWDSTLGAGWGTLVTASPRRRDAMPARAHCQRSRRATGEVPAVRPAHRPRHARGARTAAPDRPQQRAVPDDDRRGPHAVHRWPTTPASTASRPPSTTSTRRATRRRSRRSLLYADLAARTKQISFAPLALVLPAQ